MFENQNPISMEPCLREKEMSGHQRKITAKEKCEQRLLSLKKALVSLKEARDFYLKEPDKNIHVMALVKSFEFSFELSWKALKYFLEYKEVVQFRFTRDIIKQAFRRAVIEQGDLWINMLEDRNRMSHVYDEKMAEWMAEKISKKYIVEMENLYQTIKKEL